MAQRDAHDAPVERVSGRRVQHDPVDPEGSSVAVERAEVLVVVDALDDEQAPSTGGDLPMARDAGRSATASTPRWNAKPVISSITSARAA